MTDLAEIAGAIGGVLQIPGLWTPLTGTLIASVELCITFWGSAESGAAMLLGAVGASLALLGPGAYSVDAFLFGRKSIVREG